ncbi:winged helix-turn-helix domain-containing protein [soil metagenome]
MPKATKTNPSLSPRIRVYLGKEIALGPGKVALLRLVAETGSLSEAARRMKMSYMRAWLMVQVMNRSFRKPLLRTERGGAAGGGAQLTACGKQALALYDQMERESLAVMDEPWKALQAILKKG